MSETTSLKGKNWKSCAACHRKKTRCDRERPACGTCVRIKKPHLCEYAEPEWTVKFPEDTRCTRSSVTRRQTVFASTQKSPRKSKSTPKQKKSTLIVKQYKAPTQPQDKHDNEVIDFFSTPFSSTVSFSQGPLTWVSILKKDRYVNVIAFTHKAKSDVESGHKRAQQKEASTTASSTEAGPKAATNSHDSDFMNKWTKEFVTETELGSKEFQREEEDLISDILKYLNDYTLVWSTVDKFFDGEYYMIYPYIDKDTFISELNRLIGPRQSNQITLGLTRALDLSIIGILLIIMRLISDSTYNFGKNLPVLDSTTQYIIDHQIPHSIMKTINRIYRELLTLKFPNLHIFQFVCMKSCYESISPEECDCLKITDAGKLGELYHYAVQCLLHRDPDNCKQAVGFPPSLKNLRRRLWHCILFLDHLNCINVGFPKIIDETYFDTKLPSNVAATGLEVTLNDWILRRVEIFKLVDPVLKMILNLRVKPTIRQVREELQAMIEHTRKVKSFEEIVKSPCETLAQRTDNFSNFMCSLQTNALIFTIYYHFFIFYSERRDAENRIDYLIKLIKLAKTLYKPILFLDPSIEHFNCHKTFGSAILIFPKIELCIHKLTQILFSILSRIKALKLFGGDVPIDKINMCDKISTLIEKAFTYIMKQYVRASNTYFHAWFLSKIQIGILNNLVRFPKGPLPKDYVLTADDKRFIDGLVGTNENGGVYDNGFEDYTLEDLTLIYEELKDLSLTYDWKDNHSTETMKRKYVFAAAAASPSSESMQPPRKRPNSTFQKKCDYSDIISENDKKWLEKMIKDFNDRPDNHTHSTTAATASSTTATTNNNPAQFSSTSTFSAPTSSTSTTTMEEPIHLDTPGSMSTPSDGGDIAYLNSLINGDDYSTFDDKLMYGGMNPFFQMGFNMDDGFEGQFFI